MLTSLQLNKTTTGHSKSLIDDFIPDSDSALMPIMFGTEL